MSVMNFNSLVQSIAEINRDLSAQATKAINVTLTFRNWLIGYYIDTFELLGSDRAEFGDQLFANLAQKLKSQNVSNCNKRQLYRYVKFYKLYPQIVSVLPLQLQSYILDTSKLEKVGTLYPQLLVPVEKLVKSLSYSHLELLVDLGDNLKTRFYEVESLQGNWSVRELKRQINSLYYERSGLSSNKEKLSAYVQQNIDQESSALTIRDPYVFEFLGIKPQEIMYESDLEDAILNNLQEFLLELGHGFCFEARQKRILIGDEHFFVDLVFYNRILKCHVLLELKINGFSHEYLGQLNTYINWYKKNEMQEGDNPPVGILLCTHKNESLVEYALAGMDNQLFVSKYQLQLPQPNEIKEFIEKKLKELGD
jgi:predicted nuclease of restriction endonuclease-like (RecB) superfamily